ncbi:MAG: hypothetical protein IKQ88_08025 [Lachnospiraceae bacterium]|nr:hypothetical protein [Lachnospiraceae bacterium]
MKKRKLSVRTAAFLIAVLILNTAGIRDLHAAPVPEEKEESSVSENASEIIKETIEIESADDLVALSERCRLDSGSEGLYVILKNDVNLSGSVFKSIPFFEGHFNGDGHTISGYTWGGDGYVTGFFRYTGKNAVVEDLKLSGFIRANEGKNVTGGIAGINRGKIKNCSISGSVMGKNITGGIAGINENTGDITGCSSEAGVTGYYYTGGICGKNYGFISGCSNKGSINDTKEWVTEDDRLDNEKLSDINDIEDLKNVRIQSGVDTGGIAGYSKGIIISSVNSGVTGYPHTGYNVGGIAGRQAGLISGCINNGKIYGRKDIGGIAGQMEPFVELNEVESLTTSVDSLHDMIENLLSDLRSTNTAINGDFEELRDLADESLDTGAALRSGVKSYINTNTDTINELGDRTGEVTDMLPVVTDNMSDAGRHIADMNSSLAEVRKAIDSVDSYSGADKKKIEVQKKALDEAEAVVNEQAAVIAACTEEIKAVRAKYSEGTGFALYSLEDMKTIAADIKMMSDALKLEISAVSGIAHCVAVLEEIYAKNAKSGVQDAGASFKQAGKDASDTLDYFNNAQAGVSDIVTYLNAQDDLLLVGIGRNIEDNTGKLNTHMNSMLNITEKLLEHSADYPQKVGDDLRAINDQINHIYSLVDDTFSNVEDSIDNTFSDVSEYALLTARQGKITKCTNNGIVRGDINTGGITGAMAIDEDDPEGNAAGSVNTSLGGKYTTQNVLQYSVNNGSVHSKNDGAGGIVGFMRHGVVDGCRSFGPVGSSDGSYVGGIAGQSLSVILSSYAMNILEGKEDVGGIAGYGTSISGCYAIPDIVRHEGSAGAIAGQIKIDGDTEELHLADVKGNLFVSEKFCGIDGISYKGSAEAVGYDELTALRNCPEEFKKLKINYYLDEDEDDDENDLIFLGSEDVAYGDDMSVLDYPPVPSKKGYFGKWPDTQGMKAEGNMMVTAVYVKNVETLASAEKNSASGNKPLVLADGIFDDNAGIRVEKTEEPAFYADMPYTDHVIYKVDTEGLSVSEDEPVILRFYDPYGERAELFAWNGNSWDKLDAPVRGSYLQTEMKEGVSIYCVALPFDMRIAYAGAAAVLIFMAAAVIVIKKIKRRKKNNT